MIVILSQPTQYGPMRQSELRFFDERRGRGSLNRCFHEAEAKTAEARRGVESYLCPCSLHIVQPLPGSVEHYKGEQQMLDELKEEGIVNKVGRRFKLARLIQKRMVALMTGAKPLANVRTLDKLAIIVQEILQDKIYLDMSGNVQIHEGAVDVAGGAAMLEQGDASGNDD
jgi:DNA-directed RNA polymerase subunit omega